MCLSSSFAVHGYAHNARMPANRIKELRTKRKLTVVELAEKTGISHTHVTRLENGSRGLSMRMAE